MFARLRTMPIARASILGGHVVASVVINAVSVVIVFAFGLLVGYRPHATMGGWSATVALLLLTLIAFTTVGVAFGLTSSTAEGSSLFAYLLLGLLFVSSGFAPTSTMPSGLSAFADHQPMTPAHQLTAHDPARAERRGGPVDRRGLAGRHHRRVRASRAPGQRPSAQGRRLTSGLLAGHAVAVTVEGARVARLSGA